MPITRQPVNVPAAMCEAYDYARPCAFSRALEVALPGATMIFVSGTASVGSKGENLHVGDFRAQARRAFENARAVLRQAKADWHDVVKVTIFIKDIAAHYGAFNEVRNEFFRKMALPFYPASTCVEARLCREELLVEMELIAVLADDRHAAGGEEQAPQDFNRARGRRKGIVPCSVQ